MMTTGFIDTLRNSNQSIFTGNTPMIPGGNAFESQLKSQMVNLISTFSNWAINQVNQSPNSQSLMTNNMFTDPSWSSPMASAGSFPQQAVQNLVQNLQSLAVPQNVNSNSALTLKNMMDMVPPQNVTQQDLKTIVSLLLQTALVNQDKVALTKQALNRFMLNNPGSAGTSCSGSSSWTSPSGSFNPNSWQQGWPQQVQNPVGNQNIALNGNGNQVSFIGNAGRKNYQIGGMNNRVSLTMGGDDSLQLTGGGWQKLLDNNLNDGRVVYYNTAMNNVVETRFDPTDRADYFVDTTVTDQNGNWIPVGA